MGWGGMSINEQSLGRSPPKLRVIEICVKQAALRGYIQYPFIKTNARACFGAGHCQGVPASRLALECHLASRAYGSKVVGPVSGVPQPSSQHQPAGGVGPRRGGDHSAVNSLHIDSVGPRCPQ